MSPSEKEVTRAKRILVAMDEAAKAGKGAVSLDGRLIDYASIRQAEVLVKKAEQIEAAARNSVQSLIREAVRNVVGAARSRSASGWR